MIRTAVSGGQLVAIIELIVTILAWWAQMFAVAVNTLLDPRQWHI
jgi:hypothetical protein